MNNVNPSPALTSMVSFIFLKNLSDKDEIDFDANLDKTYLAKVTARSNNAFLLKLPVILSNVLPRNLIVLY